MEYFCPKCSDENHGKVLDLVYKNAKGKRGVSDETRQKMSDAKKGKPIGLGKVLTKEHRNNISKAMQGRVFSEAHKQALRKPKSKL